MSDPFTERERNTNRLVRAVAKYALFNTPTPKKLHGLAQLTWIKVTGEKVSAPRKIPALGEVFGEDFNGHSLNAVAKRCGEIAQSREVTRLVLCDTGFTGLRTAYWNSSAQWAKRHYFKLLELYRGAYLATHYNDRQKLISTLEKMPRIPMRNQNDRRVKAESYVTPVLFSLDPDIRFPVINKRIEDAMKALKIANQSLEYKFSKLYSLIGQGEIADAADLDRFCCTINQQVSLRAIVGLFPMSGKPATKALLTKKETSKGKLLSIKDEADIKSIAKSSSATQRQEHNKMTNAFSDVFSGSNQLLFEGTSDCMYDILMCDYDNKGNDLLIEVKSSVDSANIRMAVGQLYHYWFGLKENVDEPHCAILLPGKPAKKDMRFLAAMDIGLLWFRKDGVLVTLDKWLADSLHIKRTNELTK